MQGKTPVGLLSPRKTQQSLAVNHPACTPQQIASPTPEICVHSLGGSRREAGRTPPSLIKLLCCVSHLFQRGDVLLLLIPSPLTNWQLLSRNLYSWLRMCSQGFQKRLPKCLFTDFLRALLRWLKHVASLKSASSWLRLSTFPSTSEEGELGDICVPLPGPCTHPHSLASCVPSPLQLVASAQSLAWMPPESFALSGPRVALCT